MDFARFMGEIFKLFIIIIMRDAYFPYLLVMLKMNEIDAKSKTYF